MSEILLDTPCGRIRGSEENGCRRFRGIRYARTPRFEKPQETEHWDGVFDALKNGPDCLQHASFCRGSAPESSFYDREFSGAEQNGWTEDFVTLNITAPADAQNCPLLVFVHGGGFETGGVGDLPYGDCGEYAKHGIVFVSVGYRLNVFSLFRCRNLGLFDLLCALHWLQRNAAAYGGDGARITVMGQSAGAMSLTDLCLCAQAAPYVRGAILLSGGGAIPSLLRPAARTQAAPYWDSVRAAAGAPDDEALRALPAETLWRAWYKVRSATKDLRLLQPGVDGEIIRGAPADALRRGEALAIPYIFSITSQDFMPVFLYGMARRWAAAAAERGRPPVYGALFDRALPGGPYKAWHACDLWYAFGSMERSWRPFTDADRALSQQLIAAYAAFVKTGDPGVDGLAPWPALTKTQHALRRFDVQGSTLAGPAACRGKLLRTALFDKGPM